MICEGHGCLKTVCYIFFTLLSMLQHIATSANLTDSCCVSSGSGGVSSAASVAAWSVYRTAQRKKTYLVSSG